MKSIWIYDPSPSATENVRSVLAVFGDLVSFESFEAFHDQFQGLSTAPQKRPLLIVIDPSQELKKFETLISDSPDMIPFIVVSDETDPSWVHRCLSLGAKAYLSKPLNENMLAAHVEWFALNNEVQSTISIFGDLRFDLAARTLRRKDGKEVEFTAKEAQLLYHLRKTYPSPATRARLLEEIWRSSSNASKTLDVHLFHLRKKLSLLGLEIKYLPPGDYVLNQVELS